MTGAKPTLEIRELFAGYRGRPVIEGLSLRSVAAGELVALVGPNAAGKSTLLRALAGLIVARGTIMLAGHDLLAISPRTRASLVSFMPQDLPRGADLTVIEAVLSSLKASPLSEGPVPSADAHARAAESLHRIGIAELALEPLDRLSGGQRQLAGIAQSLVRNPQLLLLDEPTSALDLRHQLEVMNLLRGIAAEGRIVVVVLHDLSLAARWADRVVLLDKGRVHADAAPFEAITAASLAAVYGVTARVERCSRGRPLIVVDGPAQKSRP